LAALAFAFEFKEPIQHSEEVIKSVNSNPKAKWTAGHNKFSTWTEDEMRRFLAGTIIRPFDGPVLAASNQNFTAPDSFDAAKNWPSCSEIGKIRNQMQCGSCWAFAGSEVLGDRFCIATNGKINFPLSPQDMVSCDKSDYGCNGGYLNNEWAYMQNTGIVPDACFPYVSGSGSVPACPTTCPGTGQSMASQKYKAKSYYSVPAARIQEEVMSNGPIEVAFYVYRDFMNYKSGVYHHTSGSFLGGHAVKLNGWGVDNGTPYWIIANSWGTTWGQNGFFWILRGKDECGIESQAITGMPSV
jgi:cathepsin B